MHANYLLILHQCYTVQYSTVIHIATVTYSYKKVRTVSIVGNSNLKKRAFRTAPSEKPAKLKSERALLVTSTHH